MQGYSEASSFLKTTFSLGANYRGFGLSLALNPYKWAGKYTDLELNAHLYSNPVGVDFTAAAISSYSGTTTVGDNTFHISDKDVRLMLIQATGYYAFNHHRFSIPAAFSQSQVQKQSQGSVLLGASALAANVAFRQRWLTDQPETEFRVFHLALGVGYGYNFVFGKQHNWVLHLSCIPQIVVYADDNAFFDDKTEDLGLKFPNFFVTGRVSMIHNFSRYFVGFSAVSTSNIAGNENKLRLQNNKWNAHLFLGLRL